MSLDSPRWTDHKSTHFPSVCRNAGYDVLIVGGGITGLTAAYFLKKAGKKVCVIERNRIASGDTGYTTAHLTYVTDARLHELVKTFGKEEAQLAWKGGETAINLIEKMINELDISADFRRVPGFLHLASDSDEKESSRQIDLLSTDRKLAKEFGFDVEYFEHSPIVNQPGLRFANQAIFHPTKYLAGLAEAIHSDGSAVFENSEAAEFSDDPLQVKVNEQTIRFEHVILATHNPLIGNAGLINATLLQTKLALYSSYAIGAKIPRSALSGASFWDTAEPYNYLRVEPRDEGDYAILGGEDHKTGQKSDTEECYRNLEKKLRGIFPAATIDHRWSGQVIESPDGLPYIGSVTKNQYVATAFSGNGMTYGTLAAAIVTDSILGKENPWSELFSVDRKKILGSAARYLKENMSYPYYMIQDWLLRIDGSSPDEVKPGEGLVVSLHGKRIACSRDSEGKLQMVSAICPHMGGIVHWNHAEQTWDCPCHGSRFHADGSIIGGPTEAPLAQIDPAITNSLPQLVKGEASPA